MPRRARRRHRGCLRAGRSVEADAATPPLALGGQVFLHCILEEQEGGGEGKREREREREWAAVYTMHMRMIDTYLRNTELYILAVRVHLWCGRPRAL